MNITKESTGDLTATIQIDLTAEDYGEKVNAALKELQRKAALKGFRPGKVPFGLVKKMYGNSAMAEEVNKILSESLNNYIKDNELDILGYPIANEEKNQKVDFENQTEFSFFFDIGMAPEVNLEINDKTAVTFYNITVEDEKVDDYLKNIRNQFGANINPETAEKGDLIKGDFVQVNGDGNPIEGAVTHNSSLSIEFVKDEDVQKKFVGAKVGDKIVFNPLKATGNESETSSMLNIAKDDREKMESDYQFTLTEISRIAPAEVNKELFDKVYPTDNIETEEQFRERLRQEASKYFQKESDNFFVHETLEKLVNETDIPLPEEFVKRWMLETDDKLTKESIDHDFEHYAKSLKQQLIVNKIAKDHDIKVDEQDVRNHIKGYFGKQYMIDITDEEKSKQLDALVNSVMQNQEEVRKIYDELFDEKVREIFKNNLKLNKVDVTYDKFIETVNEHHKHHHNHEH
ncbi:MAG TPA: trigger factor [Bacteroidales bacterium]|nr:trigger factor [Bacteroidales bacterium]